jgi:ribosome recycling factor
VRNIRRDIIAEIKDLQKAKEVSEDEAKRAEEDIQKLTNEFISTIDHLMQAKEKELMSI